MEPTNFYDWRDFQSRRKDLSAALALMLALGAILALAGEWRDSNSGGPMPRYQLGAGAIPIPSGIGTLNRTPDPEEEDDREPDDAGADSPSPDD